MAPADEAPADAKVKDEDKAEVDLDDDMREAIASLFGVSKKNAPLGIVASAPNPVAVPAAKSTAKLTPFMKMCEDGNVNNVRACIEMGVATLKDRDEHGQNALQRLEDDPVRMASSLAHQTIYRLLKDMQKETPHANLV
jgi:hypothetical protein